MGQVIYFLSLNLTRIAELRKENLVKHMRKRTIQMGRLFFSSSLIEYRLFEASVKDKESFKFYTTSPLPLTTSLLFLRSKNELLFRLFYY